jgi:hypothetical protein
MAKKIKLNAYVDEELARQFKAISKVYYGRMGMCLSAAMLQFLRSDPQEQAELIKSVFDAELEQEMSTAVEAAKAEQLRRINHRESKGQSKKE